MSRRDSQTVALFVHRCMCVVVDLQAQRAELLLVCVQVLLEKYTHAAQWAEPTGRPELEVYR
jgi:hypothetical protein